MSEDDSTDWLNTSAPYLQKFEEGLRCPICRDLLVRAPSITECGHTFCGECIGRHFNSSERCPVCRTEIRRANLRLNKGISDLADLWQYGTREQLIKLATKPPSPPPPRQPISPADATYSHTHTTGTSNDKRKEKGLKEQESEVVCISDSEPEALDIPEGYGQCPVCSKIMPIDKIQSTHITQCLDKSSTPSPVSKRSAFVSSPPPLTSLATPGSPQNPSKRRKRAVFGQEYPKSKLAMPHFHSMNDSKLRNKAKEAGLSIKGSRQRVISRYMEWLTIWNSSVDDEKHPRTIAELRRHMYEWDKVQDKVSEGAPNLKKLDSKEWTQSNNDSFADLVSQARANIKKTSSAVVPEEPAKNEN